MSTVMTWQTSSTSSEQTESLGERLGKSLRGGEVIELISDVGGGKTTFVRGLAKGLGSSDPVSSPSFTIEQVYIAGSRQLHHFDFYRLEQPGIMAAELAEVVEDPNNIVVIEWGQSVHKVLPAERLMIHIKTTSENSRELTIDYPAKLAYAVQELK